MVTLPAAEGGEGTVFSVIDPRFDDRLVAMLSEAMHENRVLVTSALSRYSRNSEKLHRILEYLLAHNATVLTTNYLIRSSDVWVRRGHLVKPDSQRPYDGLTQTRGLAGTHRKLAETLAQQFGQRSADRE